jgi:hypothetical protein
MAIEDFIAQVVKDIRCIDEYAKDKSYAERASLENRRYGFVCTLGRMLLGMGGDNISNTDRAIREANTYLASH